MVFLFFEMLAPAAPKEHYYSPDPVIRQAAWSQLYTEMAAKMVRAVRRKCRWLDPEEGASVIVDAFLAAQKYRPEDGDFSPEALVLYIARRKAKSLLRARRAKKRDHIEVVLDTINPSVETDLGILNPDPDIGVIREITFRVLKLPKLQRAVGIAMIDSPDSSASELAEDVALTLGKKPTTDAVDSARKAVRHKLLPYVKRIRRELSR